MQEERIINRELIRWLGLTGVVALLSYTAAVVLSPLAYPGFDWMAQGDGETEASRMYIHR